MKYQLPIPHTLSGKPPTHRLEGEGYSRWLSWLEHGVKWAKDLMNVGLHPQSVKSWLGLAEEGWLPYNFRTLGIHPYFQSESIKLIVESVLRWENCSHLLRTCLIPGSILSDSICWGALYSTLVPWEALRKGLQDQLWALLVWWNLFNSVEPRASQSLLTTDAFVSVVPWAPHEDTL